ncbi:SpoIID/LytB domain-containing protein [Nocardia albiluteola]|nr:SpoIID/LytB domain-containing protein [Nocardia albiluteola]
MTRTKRRGIAALRRGELLRRRWHRRVAVVSVVVVATSAGGVALYWAWPHGDPVRPAAGVSEGHGRGMSQLGAFGKAQSGMSAMNILQYYYPGAQPATIAPTRVRVRLMGQDSQPLAVYSDSGLTVADRHVDPGQAVHLTPTPGGGAAVTITAGCAGDTVWQGATDKPWAYPVDPGADRPAAEHLKLCGGGEYRGALGVALDANDIRTVNEVDTEDYLRGVVPTEMSAGWADQGGAEALRAQAIAARSYALAETRYPYAQTCDTQDCQAYSGTEREDGRSDAAVRDTAGQVLLRDGHLLRTEYSSAPNGGHPCDITTMAIGPAPDQLLPAIAPAPPDPTADGAQRASVDTSAVDAKYAQTGGPTGPLGAALGPVSQLPGREGTFQLYRNGVIVATPALGAQVVDFTTLMQLAPGAAADAAPGTPGTPTPSPAPAPPGGASDQAPAAPAQPAPQSVLDQAAPAQTPPVALDPAGPTPAPAPARQVPPGPATPDPAPSAAPAADGPGTSPGVPGGDPGATVPTTDASANPGSDAAAGPAPVAAAPPIAAAPPVDAPAAGD